VIATLSWAEIRYLSPGCIEDPLLKQPSNSLYVVAEIVVGDDAPRTGTNSMLHQIQLEIGRHGSSLLNSRAG
jgi:hypothetical protein